MQTLAGVPCRHMYHVYMFHRLFDLDEVSLKVHSVLGCRCASRFGCQHLSGHGVLPRSGLVRVTRTGVGEFNRLCSGVLIIHEISSYLISRGGF